MRMCLLIVAALVCTACAATTTTDASSTAKTYTGQYSAQVVESTISTSLTGGGTFPCTNTYTMSGTLTMTIDQAGGVVVGLAQVGGAQVDAAHAGRTSWVARAGRSAHWAPTL